MAKAGAAVPSADRITLLRDADGDGVAETRTTFLEGLHSPFGMALVERRLLRRQLGRGGALPLRGRRDAHRGRRHQAGRSAGRADQPPLDEEPDRQPRRHEAVRDGRIEQQRRRARHGGGGGPGGDLGDRSPDRRAPHLRVGSAQPERHGVRTRDRRAVDGRQRARRAGQRSRPRLPDVGEGRRLLRLAVQLLSARTSTSA